jgi:hypothetical protein
MIYIIFSCLLFSLYINSSLQLYYPLWLFHVFRISFSMYKCGKM